MINKRKLNLLKRWQNTHLVYFLKLIMVYTFVYVGHGWTRSRSLTAGYTCFLAGGVSYRSSGSNNLLHTVASVFYTINLQHALYSTGVMSNITLCGLGSQFACLAIAAIFPCVLCILLVSFSYQILHMVQSMPSVLSFF